MLLKNKKLKEYAEKINDVIESAEMDGISIQPYEKRSLYYAIEIGFVITDGKEKTHVPTWKLNN